ncbi:glycoside hydrolase family 10 protein [Acholeplasma hippikon]|uniref:Uncharacterized protein conserved in bacteria n=1 Tax=Acholeplasma hippikon TaxID=264636 RepID=A0A449BK41_9MOLU|nr:family 10 glycosylhydrolase [Acholeplasma hippikon]VEU82818.1 Uncharacterized protein conserved in bacteria [Acholeplasma hippikon]
MKLVNYKTNLPLNYYQTDIQIEIPEDFKLKPMRAFWVSNVVNIDLPKVTDPNYKNKIKEMFETAKAYNINTIFFQVRTTNDAFYRSKLNPYSRFLTGKEGVAPEFDVLAYVLEEAKKYNIEVHAWCNPYRVSMKTPLTKSEYLAECDDLNFAKIHPEFTVTDKNGLIILNPAKKEVKEFIKQSMLEILENYDVAGIHFDDYFYPYAGLSDTDNDLADFEARTDKTIDLDQFRRNQITEVIKDMHDLIKTNYPTKKFGVSPFGIWKNKPNDPRGSNTDIKCSQSYDNQYADSYEWVKNGYIDYIIPQLYWDFAHPIAPYGDLLEWWVELCKDTNVDLYIGHGAYRLGSEGGYENKYEVVNQLKFANQHETVKGNCFFTYKTFIEEGPTRPGMDLVKQLLNGKKV